MKLASIRDVEIFAAGLHHKGTPEEVEFTEADLEDMVRNYRELSKGERPLHQPFVKIGKDDPHDSTVLVFEDGNPAAAWPTNLRKVGKRLLADWVDVQPSVLADIKAKRWKYCSAEIDKPDGEHPDLNVKGAVLKHLVLCNNPAVKGLKPIPFQHHMAAGKRRMTYFCFSEFKGATMSPERQQMLDALAEMGFDIALITDAIPDELLSAFVNALKAAKPEEEAEMSEGQITAGAAGVGTAVAAPPKPTQLLPKSLTAKFSEMAREIKTLTTEVNQLRSTSTATADLIGKNHDTAKRQTVHTFCEQSVKDRLLTPAEVECDDKGVPLPHTVLARLLRADHTRKHSFSEGGKAVQKTELELQMDEIRARKPHTFSERVVSGVKSDLFTKIRADVKAEVEARGAKNGKSLQEKLGLLRPAAVR